MFIGLKKIGSPSKLIFYTLFLMGLFFGIQSTYAQNTLGEEWDKHLGDLPSFEAEEDDQGERLAINFIQNTIVIVRNIMAGVALITGTIYGMLMILARGNEESIAKQRKNFVWALIGFITLIAADGIARILDPEEATNQALINFGAGRDQFRNIISYLTWIVGSIIVLFTTIHGIRLIAAGDDQEMIEKQKKSLTWSFMGILVILLARNIVNAIYVLNAPTEISAGSSENIINQITSLIRLILIFLGPVAIAFTIYAGFLYLTSLDKDEPKQKAQKMLIAGIVGIVIIYASYALVNTISSQEFAPPEVEEISLEKPEPTQLIT